eukprot:GCRY01002610.1.p1 GENE.GCRY01002610.1~~GCRY01002610.1.p1  ORF type:complete len:411 (+),score=79.79 GCRY01002610.1:245-1477(+)
MKINISTQEGEFFPFDLSDDMSVEDFRALVSAEANIPLEELVLLHGSAQQALPQEGNVGAWQINSDDMILAARLPRQTETQRGVNRQNNFGIGSQQANRFIQSMEVDRYAFSLLKQNHPELSAAVETKNVPAVIRLLTELEQRERLNAQSQQEQMRKLMEDPLDPQNQKMIEEIIRQKNVEFNFAQMMEHMPESLTRVTMLYIDCSVNNVPVKAFVDSGAQSTIISVKLAKRCNIFHLLDTRFQAVAKGVGVGKILGRIHVAHLRIGDTVFPSTFHVMESASEDLLLGLDNLLKHQACIDLRTHCLRIGEVSVPFLSEKDIPSQDTTLFSDSVNVAPPTDPSSSSSVPTSASAPPTSSANHNLFSTPLENQFPEGDIQSLMNLGFTREQAVRALQRQRGNVELAAAELFG